MRRPQVSENVVMHHGGRVATETYLHSPSRKKKRQNAAIHAKLRKKGRGK